MVLDLLRKDHHERKNNIFVRLWTFKGNGLQSRLGIKKKAIPCDTDISNRPNGPTGKVPGEVSNY